MQQFVEQDVLVYKWLLYHLVITPTGTVDKTLVIISYCMSWTAPVSYISGPRWLFPRKMGLQKQSFWTSSAHYSIELSFLKQVNIRWRIYTANMLWDFLAASKASGSNWLNLIRTWNIHRKRRKLFYNK